MTQIFRIPIERDGDLIAARRNARWLALSLGFDPTEATGVVTAVSELVRNILAYAGSGEICLRVIRAGAVQGIEVVSQDEGPGIGDLRRAMLDGYSTSGGLGLGLPGVRRLMDEFSIESRGGGGTTVTARKWRHREPRSWGAEGPGNG